MHAELNTKKKIELHKMQYFEEDEEKIDKSKSKTTEQQVK